MVNTIGVIIAIVFFVNKILLFAGKKEAWLLSLFAASFGIYYFIALKLYIFMVLEVGIIILSVYGFLVKEEKNINTEKFINYTVSIIMLILLLFTFNGWMTVYEFWAAGTALFGTYFLTHNNKSLIGWTLYIVSHPVSAYVVSKKEGQQFFADFQVASAFIAFVAMILIIEKKFLLKRSK